MSEGARCRLGAGSAQAHYLIVLRVGELVELLVGEEPALVVSSLGNLSAGLITNCMSMRFARRFGLLYTKRRAFVTLLALDHAHDQGRQLLLILGRAQPATMDLAGDQAAGLAVVAVRMKRKAATMGAVGLVTRPHLRMYMQSLS